MLSFMIQRFDKKRVNQKTRMKKIASFVFLVVGISHVKLEKLLKVSKHERSSILSRFFYVHAQFFYSFLKKRD